MGNEGVKDALRNKFTKNPGTVFDPPHSVLFVGPSGCGKTTLARITATMLGCAPEDVQEYNSSNNRGIDTIREIAQNCLYSPTFGSVKVYILDEVHRMTKDAQNALLKLLEDTPKHVFFLLATTDPEMLIKAILTRCMKFEVKSLPNPQVMKLLCNTVQDAGIALTDFSEKVLQLIVKTAEGCPRQALILLDSVIDIEDEEKALAAVSESTASSTESLDLCRLLLETRKNRWDDARFLLKGLMDDPEKMRYGILGYMNAVLMSDNCKDPDHVSGVIDMFTESFMYSGKAGLSNAVFQACKL
jgi:DNA polymerase III gamma/tau subunit